MVKPSSPSDAVNGAMASLHGKRTGIVLPNKGDVPVDNDGMENMEALFDGAKTPRPENKNEEEPRLKGKNAATKPKKTMPRLSLPGQSTDGEEEEETVADKTKRVLSRMGGGAISPSELSRVSTAPPTPTFVAIQEEEEATTKGEEEAAEHPPLSPPEGVRASPQEEQEEAVVPQESGTSPTARVELQTQEEPEDGNFAVDDDEDDMIPPPPPEPEDTDLSLREEEANATQEEVEFPVDADDDFDDDDDDKEGTGFAIVHDPETPESVRAEREKEAKEKEKKKKAKRKKKDTSSVAAKSTRSKASKSTAKPTKTKRTKKKVTITTSPTGYPAGNREYKLVPVSDFKDSPKEQGVRRSRRARVKPLAFWKNERPVYEPNHEDGVLGEAMGQMSVVAGYMSAQPTPYKKRKVAETAKSKNGNKRAKTGATLEDEEFDSRKLRKKYKFIDGEKANVWDETADEITEQKVVCYASNMNATDLPLPNTRKKSEGTVVGKAAQAFNVPTDADDNYVSYILGSLQLPPTGIKDPESAGSCSLSFTVCSAQPKSVELAFGDPNEDEGAITPKTAQRFLLGPGDMFRVLPGNSYRLENHSKTTDAFLSWTIIRPRRSAPDT